MRNLVANSSLLFLLSLSLAAEPVCAQRPQVTFRSSANLVLVNVVALGGKSGAPDSGLTRDDFRILDDGQPVPIETFDRGAATRPLAPWFVVQCRMPDHDVQGSGLFRGRISLLTPALQNLGQGDTVAVAHWCDDGNSKLDLLPTRDIEEAATVLEQVLAPMADEDISDESGEHALQNTLQLIVSATRSSQPEPLPVVIFLYGDHSGMPRSETDHFIDELLQTPAIVYGLKHRRSPQLGRFESLLWHEQAAVANYVATQTGGQYFRETPETYAMGLEEILSQLRFRYELGFKPEALDGKRHKLRVELIDSARTRHQGERLRYRAGYVAARHDDQGFEPGVLATRSIPDR